MKDTINKDWVIFVDFGNGDKFKATNFDIDNDSFNIFITSALFLAITQCLDFLLVK